MKNFLITESEKAKILGMHYKAMGKTLVNEQKEIASLAQTYFQAAEKAKPESTKIVAPPTPLTNDYINEYKGYDVAFYAADFTGRKTQYQYQCIDSEPGNDPFYKSGQIFDSEGNLTNIASELDAAGIPWKPMFSVACKPAMAVLASRKAKQQPQAQVAGATTSNSGISAEKQKQIDAAIKNGYMTKTVDPTTKAVKYISTGKGPFTIGMFQNNLPKGKEIEMD
jgi:hypothetical protein